MCYISAVYGEYGKIIVWEKTTLGNRIMKTYDPVYYFYVPDSDGEYIAIDNTKLKKLTFKRKNDFELALKTEKVKYESDFSIMERTLMDNYRGKPLPILNVGFFDIEVDFNPEIGFARISNPYAPINALTIYKTQTKEYTTLVVPPPDWNGKWTEELNNILVCSDEIELLTAFLELINDVDILSGWNSEFFDLPYIAKRLELVLGPFSVKRLNFPGAKKNPSWKEVERFGTKETIIEIEGRVHIDQLKLFRKFNLGGRPSYALAAIAEDELQIPKLQYDGNLFDLYRNDFTHFVKYNIRDVEILVGLDDKFKYIQLANSMVHEATVNFSSIFGSVNLIDSAIINFAHANNKVVLDRAYTPSGGGEGSDNGIEGALVLTPKIGLSKWVFSCDINSLYPSVYRSLNLSPEKIIGQFTRCELDWREIFNKSSQVINLRLETGEQLTEPAFKWAKILQENKWAVSAYGTVLDQGNGEGLLASVLSYWFKGRKELQAQKKEWASKAKALLSEGKTKDSLEYIEANSKSEYYDMLQGVRKVLLNSSYGATLNEWSRYYDVRLGASTTATGRQITSHMIQTIGSLISGNDTKVIKTVNEDEILYSYEGNEIIYGDTDSCYACIDSIVSNKEDAIKIADEIVVAVNDSFSDFMSSAFFCRDDFKSLIRTNREVVAESAIFQAKKKYMLYIVDLEGTSISKDDKKSFKTLGSDIKTSTTPKYIKEFLKRITLNILHGVDKSKIEDEVIKFRDNFKSNDNTLNPFDIATQGSAKVLEEYYQKWSRLEKKGLGKVNLPGHIRASINYNECLQQYADKDNIPITSGSKIKILYLKDNDQNFKSIAFPAELEKLPAWFENHFQVNLKVMEDKLIDAKLKNIFEPIGWEVPTRKSQFINSVFGF